MAAPPCDPGCVCGKHTRSGPSKCPSGCSCPKHRGRKCEPGCSCGLHTRTENRRNQFSHRVPGVCHSCGETDPEKFKKRPSVGARGTICKQCTHDREFKKRWGLTYSEMVAKWGDVCKICLQPEKAIDRRSGMPHRLSVDHDHKCCEKGCSACARGLLCKRCNYKLGQFESELNWIKWAFEYLGVKSA